MSLFEDPLYSYRETYVVLFDSSNRPSADEMQKTLAATGGQFACTKTELDDDGNLDSLTVEAPQDFAAMDIIYLEGEDVIEHMPELQEELALADLSDEDRKKLEVLPDCNARFDIFHFERSDMASEGDDFVDPGSLLLILERLAKLCNGVGIDPSSGTVT